MRARLIALFLILAAGAAAVWPILQSNRQAGIIVAIAVLTVALAPLFARGPRRPEAKPGRKDALPGHAVAMRQSRAMARAEDGEIRGIPGGPA